jgi:hypothetical protein
MTARQFHTRAIAEFLVVALCTLTFTFTAIGICSSLLARDSAGSRDFVEYWASGQQLIHNADPYDRDALWKLERSVGFPPEIPVIIPGNPPSSLLLLLPLGMVGAKAGEWIWELLLLASLIWSVQMLRAMHGHPRNLLHLLIYAFAPALSCLLSGQVTIFILLGLVLFLRLHRLHPLLAGAALWLCLLKPHLFLPFGVVLIVWIIRTRSYRILAGTGFAIAASSAVVTAMNPLIWMQYIEMMRQQRLDRVLIPSTSTMLRQYVYPHNLWLQCLPAAIGCAWALAYFIKRGDTWDWLKDGSLLILVSVFAAPYTWFMDQAVLIPALLHGAYLTRSRTLIAILALMSAVIEIAIMRSLPLLHSPFYVWSAPGWLVWYLLAARMHSTANAREVIPESAAELNMPVGS